MNPDIPLKLKKRKKDNRKRKEKAIAASKGRTWFACCISRRGSERKDRKGVDMSTCNFN